MEPYIDVITLTEPDGTDVDVSMRFKDGIAIEVDENGDVPLFGDPIVLTYPSADDMKENPSLADEVEGCTGRRFDKYDPCYFDIALAFGKRHKLSEIVKR